MANLSLKCMNCGRTFQWSTPYPTYVGKPGEREVNTGSNIHPTCPSCQSIAVKVLNQDEKFYE